MYRYECSYSTVELLIKISFRSLVYYIIHREVETIRKCCHETDKKLKGIFNFLF